MRYCYTFFLSKSFYVRELLHWFRFYQLNDHWWEWFCGLTLWPMPIPSYHWWWLNGELKEFSQEKNERKKNKWAGDKHKRKECDYVKNKQKHEYYLQVFLSKNNKISVFLFDWSWILRIETTTWYCFDEHIRSPSFEVDKFLYDQPEAFNCLP